MPRDISYSDGSTVKNAVVVVWEDLHEERAGFYRAFWADGPEGTCGSPVLGYCQAGGSPGRRAENDLEAQRTNGGGRTRDLQGVQRHTRAGVSPVARRNTRSSNPVLYRRRVGTVPVSEGRG